jgi:lysophospholipase
MPDKNIAFSQEHQLKEHYKNTIEEWWQQVTLDTFYGIDDVRISYAYYCHEKNTRNLVISPGRCESFLKYKELCYDLSQQGYNIFILDHRGQGMSQRMLTNKHKGYVFLFDHYAQDLHTFIHTIVNTKNNLGPDKKTPYLLAHSMGGAIALRMLELYPSSIRAALLSSPMLAINTGSIPPRLAAALIKTTQYFNSFIGKEPWYFLGQKDYQASLFSDNYLTRSAVRYQHFIDIYQTHPEIQLGGVTVHWLNEAINAKKTIFKQIGNIRTPIRVLQAGSDTIVDNSAQTYFCKRLYQLNGQYCVDKQPIVIEGAQHELLFEQDQYRNKALNYALDWFDKYAAH